MHNFAFESDNRMLIGGRTLSTPYRSYLIQTFPKTISMHYNVTESNFSFSVKSNTSYPIVSGAISNYSLVDYPMSEFTVTSYTDTYTYLDFWESDISYWDGNTSYVRELQSSTYYEIDIYLTCSVSGSTSITYDLTSDDNGTVPDWIALDTSDRKLKFTTPQLNADTNFTFSVEATVSGDTNTYINKYYLEVLHSI